MSELRVASRVDAASWNTALRALNGTVFHAAEWADCTIAEQPMARPTFYTMLDENGSVSGLALGFRQASARNLTAPFSGRRWLDALPVVRNGSPAELSRFVSLIERDSRHAGDVTIRMGSFASPGSAAILRSLGYSLAMRFEFELDLKKDEKSLWEGIDIKRRQRIRKAMKSGVEVRELPVEEGVFHLRRLQEASFVRIVARGGPSLNKRESPGEDPITALTGRGLGRIVGGFVDGECVSASFFSTFNGLAYYALSGHDAKALASQAPSLVLWEMLLRFQREGFKRLNFGGCGIGALDEGSSEHGVYTYKKAFGGARLDCASGEKVLRPAVRRVANLLRSVVR
jgi:GNAT acetyltransferase-like protein